MKNIFIILIFQNGFKNFFTLSELICSYFEQIILINYQYEKNYNNNEIIFPYDSDFNNFIDNNQKIYEFLFNSINRINIFKQIDFKKIENEIKSNEKINEEINKRSKIDEFIIKNYTSEFPNSKIKTIEEQINDIYLFLYKIFEYGDKKFIISLIFITDDKIFTVNDFVFKKVFEQINEQFNIKINNDLIQEKIENKKKKRKKKKKKKKNNNENSNEIENEIKNEINDENNNNIIENNENSNEINSILDSKNEKKFYENESSKNIIKEEKNNLIEKKEDINNIH